MSSPSPRLRLALASLVLAGAAAACADDGSHVMTSASGDGGAGGGGGGDPACEGISKGPWAIGMTETGITLRWEACSEGTDPGVTIKPEVGGGDGIGVDAVASAFDVTTTNEALLAPETAPDLPGTYYMHEAKVDGLEEGTCYAYTLDGDEARGGRFCTSRPSGSALRFLAIGDTNPGLGDTTDKILAQVVPLGFDFTVHAGDIQYYASLLETWSSWFPHMQPLLSAGAFMPAVGNHEDERPKEFDEYYTRFFAGEGDGAPHYYRYQSAGVWFFSLDTELPFGLASPQGTWLAQGLAEAAATPGFVTSIIDMHRPFVTCGDSDEHSKERDELASLFTEHGVSLVVQGHMHGYERFDIDGVTYLTTGGGGGLIGDIDENIDRPYCGMRVASGDYHHAIHLQIAAGELSGKVIDEEGVERDTFEKVL